MAEFQAGDDQVIVTYGTEEFPALKGSGLTVGLLNRVAADADARARDGWRIATLDTTITGYEETPAVLFSFGHGHATEVVITVVYARQASSAP